MTIINQNNNINGDNGNNNINTVNLLITVSIEHSTN